MTPRAAWLTTATLAMAMLTYVLAVPGSELVLVLMPITIGVRTFAYRRSQPLAPQWFIAVCTFTAVFYAAYRVIELGPDERVLAEFVGVLAVIKSLERWSARDDLQMLLVAIFIVLVAIITSSSIVVGAMLLLFVPLLGYTAMALQIEGALSFGEEAEGGTQRRLGHMPSLRCGSFVGTFAMAMVMVLSIAVVAFVLLPRGIGSDTIRGLQRPVIGQATGFRNSVELGRGGLISNDQTIVMEVEIRDPRTGHSRGATGHVYHLRGTALSTYSRGQWTGQSSKDADENYTARQAGLRYDFSRERFSRADLKQIVHLTPAASDGGILFTVWRPIRIDFSEAQNGTLSIDNARRTVSLTDSKSKLTTYEVFSVTAQSVAPGDETADRTPTSFGNETIAGIAAQVLRDAEYDPDPAVRPIAQDYLAAAAIESWLAVDGGFTYTLEVESAPPRRDPIEWFLTDARSGHCEYYASAMAAMCRAVGINSRVVTGYMLAEYDPSSERYIVRRSNAHAWVEAETAPGTWVTFDPTPNVSALHVPDASGLRLLRRFLDAVDGFWLSSVVSYDEGNQLRLLGIEHINQTDAFRDRQLVSRGKRVMRVVFIVLIAGLAAMFVLRWYRKPSALRVGEYELDLPEAALLVRARLLRHWDRSGRSRPAWAGLVAHATDEPERELAEMLTASAFGRRPWSRETATQAEALLRRLESGPGD